MREAGVDGMVSADITGDLWKKFMFIGAFSGMTPSAWSIKVCVAVSGVLDGVGFGSRALRLMRSKSIFVTSLAVVHSIFPVSEFHSSMPWRS